MRQPVHCKGPRVRSCQVKYQAQSGSTHHGRLNGWPPSFQPTRVTLKAGVRFSVTKQMQRKGNDKAGRGYSSTSSRWTDLDQEQGVANTVVDQGHGRVIQQDPIHWEITGPIQPRDQENKNKSYCIRFVVRVTGKPIPRTQPKRQPPTSCRGRTPEQSVNELPG